MSGQTATLVGSSDRQLVQLLRAMGLRLVSVPASELASLARAGGAPDVLVVDVRDSAGVPEHLGAFRREHPTTGIVLVAHALEPTLMLDAMRAGVNECVTDPLTASELEAAVGRVGTRRPSTTTGQVYAFVGAKGGVGATTLAVNVATALARGRRSTLLIDLHASYGDTAVFFGVEPKFSVVDALDNIHRLDRAFFGSLVVSTQAGPDLLASAPHSVTWTADAQRVRQLVEFAAAHYQHVVVDCPRSDAAVLDALDAVQTLVLVGNQELATVRSVTRMAATLRRRYGAERVLVAMTRYDEQSDIRRDDIERVVGGTVRHMFPSDYRTCLEALNGGRPLVLSNHSRLAAAVERFTDFLAGHGGVAPETQKSARSGGFLSRLTGKRL
ncbi:MAG: AAA family ATPase [Vicinamibacterales bacterium]